jgi:hypothetical protein
VLMLVGSNVIIFCILMLCGNALETSGITRNFFRGVQQIQLRTGGRENGDLRAVAP